jgi:hypothetical protein
MGMLDIQSVFPEVSNSALQDRDTQQMIGWQGLQNLARKGLSNMNQQVRGGLFQATGQEGVLSPEMQMGRAVSAFSENPNAAGADQKLLEATRRFAPDKVPALLQSMEQKRKADQQEAHLLEEAQFRRNEEQRRQTDQEQRNWEHQQRVDQVEKLKTVTRSRRERHISMYKNENFRDVYEAAGMTEDFLKTAEPAVVDEALTAMQQMTGFEHDQWRMEREKHQAGLEDESRDKMNQIAQHTTRAMEDFVENSDSSYLRTLRDVLQEFPTPENYGNFMAEFGKQEAEKREQIFQLMKAAGGNQPGYEADNAEISDAMSGVIAEMESNGMLQRKGLLGMKKFEAGEDMTREEQRIVQQMNSQIRNVIEMAARAGYAPNSEGVKQLAIAYVNGASEREIGAILQGQSPVATTNGQPPGTPVSTPAQDEAVSLDQALNTGGTGLPELQGPRQYPPVVTDRERRLTSRIAELEERAKGTSPRARAAQGQLRRLIQERDAMQQSAMAIRPR